MSCAAADRYGNKRVPDLNPLTPGSAPDPNAGVWPPPPSVYLPQAQTYPFVTLLRYVQGSVPDFRVGTVVLSPEGISIQGKAVVRTEIQVPILIVCLFLCLGLLAAYAIMEYGFRREAALSFAWADVREIVLTPNENRACIVYAAPNYQRVMKTFSLTFKLDPALYASFVEEAGHSIPWRVREGKLRAWTSPAAWVFSSGVIAGCTSLLIIFLVGASGL